jgi:hypothetical protein
MSDSHEPTLLSVLKNEWILLEARARGAKRAYGSELEDVERERLRKKGITPGVCICINYVTGSRLAVYSKVSVDSWTYGDNLAWIWGTFLTAKGVPSKQGNNELINTRFMHEVRVEIPPPTLVKYWEKNK